MAGRRLAPDEAALWARVMATVRPMAKVAPTSPGAGEATAAQKVKIHASRERTDPAPLDPIALELLRHAGLTPPASVSSANKQRERDGALAEKSRAKSGRGGSATAANSAKLPNTLDASWDRQLARGLAAPDRTIDLHGHTLASAHTLLDTALDRAIRGGERVVLLITGKPPRPESERPHARGAIRAAVGDWLAGSRHAASIAAVRGAHPRHGGSGALYIVLRRARFPQKS